MDVTTYPASTEAEKRAAHAKYLDLERAGKVTRYNDCDGTNHPSGAPFIIWRSVEDDPAVPVPEDEPAP